MQNPKSKIQNPKSKTQNATIDRRTGNCPWLYGFARTVLQVYFTLCRWQRLGREHIPASGPCLLMANHVSHLDPPAVGCAFPRALYYMAKTELFSIPILSPLIRRLGAFPVERGRPDRAALRQALSLLEQGKAVLVFPEGQRSPTGFLQPAERGAGLLALMASCPVIPVGLTGTDRALPRGSVLLRFHSFAVRFGPPVPIDDLRANSHGRKRTDEACERIMAAIAGLLSQG